MISIWKDMIKCIWTNFSDFKSHVNCAVLPCIEGTFLSWQRIKIRTRYSWPSKTLTRFYQSRKPFFKRISIWKDMFKYIWTNFSDFKSHVNCAVLPCIEDTFLCCQDMFNCIQINLSDFRMDFNTIFVALKKFFKRVNI